MTAAAAQVEWGERIPDPEWEVYHLAIREARRLGIPFAFGGAFALAVYTGSLRNTKDFDFYVRPEDRDAMVRALTAAGLEDYFDRLPYDRSWIYRGSRDDIIVDVIWAMANQRARVDDEWLTQGPEITIRGERLHPIPVEELIWSKLYVLQRERCDWGDVLNLLDAQASAVDWKRLLGRLGEDRPLLAGALALFAWLVPDRVDHVPVEVWSQLGVSRPGREPPGDLSARVKLLDSRPWFTRQLS
ncbi:MAG TPA: hypothetical protein VD930_08295 [Gemmatimonadales bacterium]|nr:hypothetical protein [Gemmatimonadales bacterium]